MSHRRRRPSDGRRGAALVVALASLVLLMAVAIALHAVALRERRSARRATLVRAASDAAEGALARWQVRLASGDGIVDSMVASLAGDVTGTRRELEHGAGEGSAGELGERVAAAQVHVTIVTLARDLRLLVSEGTAGAGGLRARRRVSLLLVPDSLPAVPVDSARDDGSTAALDSAVAGTGGAQVTALPARLRYIRAPERSWAELP